MRILHKLAERLRRPRELDAAEGYRRWAAGYGLADNAFQELEAAARERLAPPLAGRRVLDLGCGPGRVAAWARRRGAARVVGADASLAMLRGAGAGDGPRLAADVRALPLRRESFDVVVCALVLGHVADLGGALAETASVLAPGGHLLISDFHPFATLRGWQRTFVDPASAERFAVEQHLHLLSDYVDAFARLGLTLEGLEEPRWEDVPVVFALRALKIEVPADSPILTAGADQG